MEPKQHVEMMVIGEEATLVNAFVVADEDGQLTLRPDRPVPDGASVCVRSDTEGWAYGRAQVVGTDVVVTVRGTARSDQREFFRVQGAIHCRYQIMRGEDSELARRRWKQHGTAPSDAWREPEPYMDFSASGLAFYDGEACAEEDILLLEIGVPEKPERYRTSARVVRLIPLSDEERAELDAKGRAAGAIQTVAIHFLDIEPDAIEALVAFTETIQETYI